MATVEQTAMARAWRGLAVAVLVLVARPRGVSASCTSNSDCEPHGSCKGYDPGDPGTKPPVPATQGHCARADGWSGDRCDHATGCDGGPCEHGGKCSVTGGSHSCDCSGTGYTGDQACNKPVSCGAAPYAKFDRLQRIEGLSAVVHGDLCRWMDKRNFIAQGYVRNERQVQRLADVPEDQLRPSAVPCAHVRLQRLEEVPRSMHGNLRLRVDRISSPFYGLRVQG